MANDILVIAEQRDGELKKVTFEILGRAQALAAELGGQAAAVVLGNGVSDTAGTLAQHGAGKVYVGDDPALGEYSPDGWASVIAELAGRTEPAAILGPATSFGKDLVPRVAAKLGAGVASDVTGLEVSDGRLLIKRPIYAGKAIATVRVNTDPQVATVRPNTFPVPEPDAGANADVEALDLAGYEAMAVATDVVTAGSEKLDVAEAEIIVSGGRGMGRRTTTSWKSWPLFCRTPPSALRAPRWTPAGDLMGIRWGRQARPFRPTCTSPVAFRAQSSTWPA